jgi:N utilization substance protein B
MINRILIRIKVLQIFFAYCQRNDGNLQGAEKELLLSIDKTYSLYHFLLLLIVVLSDSERNRIDKLNRYPDPADTEPNFRLCNNRLAEQLRTNLQLVKFAEKNSNLRTDENRYFIKTMLGKILDSDFYSEYVNNEDSYNNDREFWYKTLKYLIVEDEDFIELIEGDSIYWGADDIDIAATFALRSIKQFDEQSTPDKPLYPMFIKDEYSEFAVKLLHHSIIDRVENKERITRNLKNWEIDRLAQTDLNILQIAIAELMYFPSIPVTVTMNEYIDMSRYFSTPKSPNFINGTIDAIIKELQSEGKLFKS